MGIIFFASDPSCGGSGTFRNHMSRPFVNGSLALTCVPDLGKLALLGLGWLMSQMQGRHCPKSTSRLIIQMDGGIAGMKFC